MSGKAAAASTGEWLVAGFGLLLVVAVLGYLVYSALTEPVQPPLIAVEAGEVQEYGAGYQLSFIARNDGSETAAGVTIVGELIENGLPVESSQATVDYVPGDSQRSGGLFFTRDPGQFRLVLRATGYETP